MTDIYTPAHPNNQLRCAKIEEPGLWRLARRDCSIYAIMVHNNVFGRLRLMTGTGRGVYAMPSIFSGSFGLCEGFCEQGLVLEVHTTETPNITIIYRERDKTMV